MLLLFIIIILFPIVISASLLHRELIFISFVIKARALKTSNHVLAHNSYNTLGFSHQIVYLKAQNNYNTLDLHLMISCPKQL